MDRVRAAMNTVLWSDRIPGRIGQAVRAVDNGVWLGLLSDDQHRRLDEDLYARETDYRTAAWNERGLTWWEQEELERHFSGVSRVVVTACGGGREVLALLQAGYDAVGYESHPALSAYADRFLAERGHPGRAHPSPRDVFPDPGPCDGVIVGWGAYSLISPRQKRVRLLAGAAAATAKGGPVMLSCFARPVHGRELRLTARLARALRRRRNESPVELGDTMAPSRVHVFTQRELQSELAEAGLKLDAARAVTAANAITSYMSVIGRVR